MFNHNLVKTILINSVLTFGIAYAKTPNELFIEGVNNLDVTVLDEAFRQGIDIGAIEKKPKYELFRQTRSDYYQSLKDKYFSDTIGGDPVSLWIKKSETLTEYFKDSLAIVNRIYGTLTWLIDHKLLFLNDEFDVYTRELRNQWCQFYYYPEIIDAQGHPTNLKQTVEKVIKDGIKNIKDLDIDGFNELSASEETLEIMKDLAAKLKLIDQLIIC